MFAAGVICVAPGRNGEWFRAEVVSLNDETGESTVRLVDEGGYLKIAIEELRQIRFDFVTIPFQATECRLIGVAPLENSSELTASARAYFENICQGQILQAHVVGYTSPANQPLIYLYRINESQVLKLKVCKS